MTATCPLCAGPFFDGHPAGVLTARHAVTCAYLRAEDATKAADHGRGAGLRPATMTELVMHQAATGQPGPVPPAGLFIRTKRITNSIIHRAPELWNTAPDGITPQTRIKDQE